MLEFYNFILYMIPSQIIINYIIKCSYCKNYKNIKQLGIKKNGKCYKICNKCRLKTKDYRDINKLKVINNDNNNDNKKNNNDTCLILNFN